MVALHDHAVLQKAWQSRLDALEANPQVMSDPEAKNDLDALRWFMMSPSQRETLCRKGSSRDNRAMSSSDSNALKRFPGPCLLRILRGIRTLYRDSPLYRQMLAEVESNLHSNVQPGHWVPRDIAVDMAIDVCQDPFFDNVSRTLCHYFGFSKAAIRRDLDPIVAEMVPDVVSENGSFLDYECDRWRVGDQTFRCLVEDAYLRTVALRQFRDGELSSLVIAYASDDLKASMDARIKDLYTKFETFDGAIFEGDTALEKDVMDLLAKISQCSSLTTFRGLCEASQKLPHRIAPLMMQRLASRASLLSNDGLGTSAITLDKMALFDAFLAWRDRIMQSLVASGDSRLMERAYAAALSIWGKVHKRADSWDDDQRVAPSYSAINT